MNNKLIIIKKDLENYMGYEINGKYYLKREFDYNDLIRFISKKFETHSLYFKNFDEEDILDLQKELDNFFLDNYLDNELLYDINYRNFNNESIEDYLINNKLKEIKILQIPIKEKNNIKELEEEINKVKVNKKIKLKVRKIST